MKSRPIELPYRPRTAFLPFHERRQRWACLVAHRRAGKTVAAVNDLIRGAVTTQERRPLFGYIAPYRSQAKSVAWDYLKYFAKPITRKVNESDLILETVTDAEIRLFGADNADAMRGLGFCGIVGDEIGDWRPSVWGSVVRPTLSDRNGWAVFMGTPKGRNHFYDIYDAALMSPDTWFTMVLKASESKLLPESELFDLKRQLTEDQYLQEMECSFDAAILGAFYGTEMRLLDEKHRITHVAYDPSLPCYTAWDLGYKDDTAIFWFQVIRDELHVIDFYAVSGASIPDICKVVLQKPYHYERHFLPHDARAKTLASGGKSIIEQVGHHLGLHSLSIVPDLSVQDGIQAVRMMLPHCWFDAVKCKEGIEALRQYEREWDDDKKAFREKPRHNWCSHPADAARMMAISWTEEQPQRRVYPDRALVVGPTNTATLEDMYAAAKRMVRRVRI